MLFKNETVEVIISYTNKKKASVVTGAFQVVQNCLDYFLAAFTSTPISMSLLIIHSAGSASEVPNLIPQSARFTVNLACKVTLPSTTATFAGKETFNDFPKSVRLPLTVLFAPSTAFSAVPSKFATLVILNSAVGFFSTSKKSACGF